MIRFLDMEASSLLAGSFPIEIAWVDENGRGESHLIRPRGDWLADGCPGWSRDSEAVHGIGLDRLLAEGKPLDRVAARAAEALAANGVTVYSDAPAFDGFWLEMLLNQGGREGRVAVRDVQEVYAVACRPLLAAENILVRAVREAWRVTANARPREMPPGRAALRVIATAEEAEARRAGVRHRALPDAERLWRTWHAVTAEVGRLTAGQGPPDPEPPLVRVGEAIGKPGMRFALVYGGLFALVYGGLFALLFLLLGGGVEGAFWGVFVGFAVTLVHGRWAKSMVNSGTEQYAAGVWAACDRVFAHDGKAEAGSTAVGVTPKS